jgi:hypothetical protein
MSPPSRPTVWTNLSTMITSYLRAGSFDRDTHWLHPSRIQFLKRASRLSTVVLRVLAVLGCTELTTLPDGTILEATNLTLLNVLLLRFGPMREKRLTQALIGVQVMLAGCFARVNMIADYSSRWREASLPLSCAMVWRI